MIYFPRKMAHAHSKPSWIHTYMIRLVNYVAGDTTAVLDELDMTFFIVASIKILATCRGQKVFLGIILTLLRLK